MIFYIGDISIQDAFVLKMLAENSINALEFGCGASTQVIRHYSKGSVRSVDTEQIWIDRTKRNLQLLGINTNVDFFLYGDNPITDRKYDFIFSDGLPELRLDFAMKHWDMLSPNGVLAFHDTRREHDFNLCLQLMQAKCHEIESAMFNVHDSNITVIHKRKPIFYDDWNKTEMRLPWQYGHADIDINQFKILRDEHNRSK